MDETQYLWPEKYYYDNLQKMYQKHYDIETDNGINTGLDYSIHFDLIDYIVKWCECENEIDCKQLLQQLTNDKEVFLGEFV